MFAASCASKSPLPTSSPWASSSLPPVPPPVYRPQASANYPPYSTYPVTPAPTPYPSAPANTGTTTTLRIIPRTSWTNTSPIASSVNPMGSVGRITVHHEGSTPVYFDDAQTTIKRLQLIQTVHVRDNKWADIGYHYIIDRAGRIWEGRPLQFQGAHVKANNEHNAGIMVLGNFDKQPPTNEQISSLLQTVVALRRANGVPVNKLYTHQEINPTQCPGTSLQGQMVNLRRGGYFA